jgi:hypothetical protein
MFEAKGTVKLPTDQNEREHTFHFRNADFAGDLEKAKAHIISEYPGIKNVRVRYIGTRLAVQPATTSTTGPAAAE